MKNNELLKKYLSLLPAFTKKESSIKSFLGLYVISITLKGIQSFIFLESKKLSKKAYIMYRNPLCRELNYTIVSIDIKDMNRFITNDEFRIKIENSKEFEDFQTTVELD